ncbi:MAG: sigma-70 family RNA polymerase sigma factor [Planctomycetes bacterium]|nr:sigma-70 family RNA polymerase sigma factor [Planctomycetota bacterium]
MPSPGDVTQLLARVRAKDESASSALFALLYEELRALAAAAMQRGAAGHTLQPTAIVHEAWIKLAAPDALIVHDREHFLALAARAMRQVLVDHARGRAREKRGGDRERVTLDGAVAPTGLSELDVLALEEALERLANYSELKARVVELRFYGGLTLEEIGHVLDLSTRTVDREWRFARAWLAEALGGETGADA